MSTGKGLPSGGIHTPSIRDLPCLYAENRGRTVLSALFVNVNTELPGFGIVKRRCRRLDNLFKLSLSLSSFLVAQTVRGRAALSAKRYKWVRPSLYRLHRYRAAGSFDSSHTHPDDRL